jgi:hypothetical protein
MANMEDDEAVRKAKLLAAKKKVKLEIRIWMLSLQTNRHRGSSAQKVSIETSRRRISTDQCGQEPS